jgi:S-adenosylmethionine/arginine decarboxylase-like enzyme
MSSIETIRCSRGIYGKPNARSLLSPVELVASAERISETLAGLGFARLQDRKEEMTYKTLSHGGILHYGKQLLVNAGSCDPRIREIATVAEFIGELPGRVGMKAFGEALVYRFGEGNEVGLSGVQLLYSSAIVIHTNDLERDLYFDLFSCHDFEESDVIDHIVSHFAPKTYDHQVIYRR